MFARLAAATLISSVESAFTRNGTRHLRRFRWFLSHPQLPSSLACNPEDPYIETQLRRHGPQVLPLLNGDETFFGAYLVDVNLYLDKNIWSSRLPNMMAFAFGLYIWLVENCRPFALVVALLKMLADSSYEIELNKRMLERVDSEVWNRAQTNMQMVAEVMGESKVLSQKF